MARSSRTSRFFRLLAAGAMLYMMSASAPVRAEYPLLEQLSQQTQSLYNEVQSGIVKVQLPTALWVRDAQAKNDPLQKWDGVVDPHVRDVIMNQRTGGGRLSIQVSFPSTRPTTMPAVGNIQGSWVSRRTATGEIVLEPAGNNPSALVIQAGGTTRPGGGAPAGLRLPAPGNFVPNNIGLILDDAGHVLVPVFIEKEAIGQAPVRMMVGNEEASATFVGSDEKTQVTILKLTKHVGRPVRLTGMRPADGSLVMLLNPSGAAGKLTLWTGGERDYGIVVNLDGSVAGIVRYGQFLAGSASRPVIDQIIRVGAVQRAILGARLTEIRSDDPARKQVVQLGDHPALLIDEVTPGSLAERAGLQRGDFILELGGEPVGDLTTWSALSAKGGQTSLLILRGETSQRVTINLAP